MKIAFEVIFLNILLVIPFIEILALVLVENNNQCSYESPHAYQNIIEGIFQVVVVVVERKFTEVLAANQMPMVNSHVSDYHRAHVVVNIVDKYQGGQVGNHIQE